MNVPRRLGPVASVRRVGPHSHERCSGARVVVGCFLTMLLRRLLQHYEPEEAARRELFV